MKARSKLEAVDKTDVGEQGSKKSVQKVPAQKGGSDAPIPRLWGIELKWVSLTLLTLQTGFGCPALRYLKQSQKASKSECSDASIVFVSEMIKFTVSFILLLIVQGESLLELEL
eukprot:TRINITY_DN36541_c0_g1_i1.p1 TRINITY_DN36541_c0_g1~~TRINITY_DN36541_c0_g1_i1.p1  ORF type:complete len:114 (+),score=17.86 TRINITY_DN36541_c0_g1_i1:113-454(+)